MSYQKNPYKTPQKNNRKGSDGKFGTPDSQAMEISPQKASGHKTPNAIARREENQNLVDRNPFGWIEKFEQEFFKDMDNSHKQIQNTFKGFGAAFKMPSIMEAFGNLADCENDMNDFNRFSRLPDNLSRSQGPSKVMMRSYVQSTKMDPQGRKYDEKYFSNDFAVRGEDGTTVGERQQGYRNSNSNIERIAEERLMNGRGKKLIQERHIGEQNGNRMMRYMGMDENNVQDFDRNWDQETKKLGFYEDFGHMLGYSKNMNRLADDFENNHRSQENQYNRKKNDIYPTSPNRLMNEPVRRPEEDQPLELEGPRFERNERRFEPVRNTGTYQRNDGNFYNRNVGNSMPRAG
jgi:hypothetical protein